LFSGQSGRLHRTDAGDWVWSSDDNDSSDSDDDDSPDESPDDSADGITAATVKKSVSTSPGKLTVYKHHKRGLLNLHLIVLFRLKE
jgi:hypothetical protein